MVASGRKHASGAASVSARGQVSASGGRVGTVPDLIKPLTVSVAEQMARVDVGERVAGLVVTTAGTRLIVLDSHIRGVVAEASARVTAA